MGYSLYLQRRWAEAEMNLRQAIAFDNKHSRAHNNLALVLAQNSRLNDALSEFHKGGSNAATAHANLAFVLTMERRWEEARAQYQLALAADPSSTELKTRLEQLDTLAAKLNPTGYKVVGTQDARVMTASADIARRSWPPNVSARPIPISSPTVQGASTEVEHPTSDGPRVHIPPPVEFKASKFAATDGHDRKARSRLSRPRASLGNSLSCPVRASPPIRHPLQARRPMSRVPTQPRTAFRQTHPRLQLTSKVPAESVLLLGRVNAATRRQESGHGFTKAQRGKRANVCRLSPMMKKINLTSRPS